MIDKEAADNFIVKVKALGIKPGLVRIQSLLNRIGAPNKNIKIIHVAGTNGKGSTLAMLQYALFYNGYKVGKFSSPGVFDEYEQYMIDDECITKAEYLGFLSTIIDATNGMTDEELPTYFEVQVALALLFFESNHVDFALIETGMGGIDDATNVFDEVICSVITSISLDHMEYLGDTICDIALAKAGIMKKGCYTVVASQEKEACDVLKSYAYKIDSKLQFIDYHHVRYNSNNNTVSFREFKNVHIPFFGDFQLDNTLLALETLHIIKYQRYKIDIKKAIDGIEHAKLQGRMEKISDNPLIYIDGCHNRGAAYRIKETILSHFKGKKITFIMGVLKDKEVTKMLNILLPLGDAVVTVTPDNTRALSASMLANQCFLYDIDVAIAADFDDCVSKALDYNNDVYIALGSLSYLKDIKAAFEKKLL